MRQQKLSQKEKEMLLLRFWSNEKDQTVQLEEEKNIPQSHKKIMEHYFSEKQSSSFALKKIRVKIKGLDFDIYSAPGIFSKSKVDNGTRLLIEKAIVKGKVLDLGCGNGIIGIALKKLNPELNVFVSDVNERAVEVSKMNSKGLDIIAVKSDGFDNLKEKFDTILLNPPLAAGKDLCFRLIKESYAHLNKNGLFELVAKHNKGGKTYMKCMQEVFGNAKDIAKASGYRIYLSKKIVYT